MKPKGRKYVALFALLAAGVMLWLERESIQRGSGESIFWVLVAGLAILLALAELAGVGRGSSGDAPK